MAVLLASIFFSGVLAFIFKLFPRFDIDMSPAIVINYITCFVLGSILLGYVPLFGEWNLPSFKYAVLLGIIFIAGFNFIGRTVQQYGIAIATLMQKMSLVITVLFAILFLHEDVTALKTLGLVLALIAIYLSNHPDGKSSSITKVIGFLPFMTWLISGLIEVILLYVQKTGIASGTDPHFVTMLFGTAAIIGLLFAFTNAKQRSGLLKKQNIIGGIVLGVPNFFSIYFLMMVLDLPWDGSVIIPINNIGIMIFAALGAWLIFKERFTTIQIIGLTLASISLLILSSL